jgi:hypothetical protein
VPGPELHFLDLDLPLFELGFVLLLGFGIFVLAVVHQTAHRRFRGRCDLDQIHPCLFGHLVGRSQTHYADLFALDSDQANFGRVDLFVDPRISIFISILSDRLAPPKN